MFRKILILCSFILFSQHSYAAKTQSNITKIKNATVSISKRVSLSATSSGLGLSYGSGFLVNKEKGIILTNRHVISSSGPASYLITFYNGIEAKAKLLYHDEWADFAFLSVDPSIIPSNTEELELDEKGAALDQKVTILSNSEGKDFSIHDGKISNLYNSEGIFPFQSIVISTNVQGGSSGSSVVNNEGKVIAIVYGGGGSYCLAVHIGYVSESLKEILKTGQPLRKHTGVLVEYYSLNHAVDFLNFPENEIKKYLNAYPESFNKSLRIYEVLKGSPAEKSDLMVGDIIWKVNGQEIGPNLLTMDLITNKTTDNVTYTIYRDGKLLDIKVGIYNLSDNKIERIVSFGGATFFEANDYVNLMTSSGPKKLMFMNVAEGSSFYDIISKPRDLQYLNIIDKMSDIKINSLDDLIENIPFLIKKENFTMTYSNHGLFFGFGETPFLSRNLTIVDIRYDSLQPHPTIYKFDKESHDWKSEIINIADNKK